MVDNFAGQWLYLRNMGGVYPDPNIFPEFDENLREAFHARDGAVHTATSCRSDASVLELLSADYTYVNQRLAEHYGIPNIYGNRFRRVNLDGVRRGGLPGPRQRDDRHLVSRTARRRCCAASGCSRTCSARRRRSRPRTFPALEERNEDGEPVSMREAMAQHRENPACSVCHAPMDPIGFALQNYDAIGGWRDVNEGNTPRRRLRRAPRRRALRGPRRAQRPAPRSRPDEIVGTSHRETADVRARGAGLE